MQPIYTINKTSLCPNCNGTGISLQISPITGNSYESSICLACKSTGKITEQVSLKEVLIELGFISPITIQESKKNLTPQQIAESAIDLFLEYRDKHGCYEDDARAKALFEIFEYEIFGSEI